MSKGDTPRPLSITPQQYANNWARIFGPDATVTMGRGIGGELLHFSVHYPVAHTEEQMQHTEATLRAEWERLALERENK